MKASLKPALKPALAIAAVLLATACGSGSDGDTIATDPAGSSSPAGPAPSAPDDSDAGSSAMPTAVPASPGDVRTRDLVTVIQQGDQPVEMCLGAITQIYPPQCGGPVVDGWDWADQQDMFESEAGVRFGQFALTGTFDGTSLTYGGAIPAALYDVASVPVEPTPSPATTYPDSQLAKIADVVGQLPGAGGAYVDGPHVLVDVTYDDGSLQAWADEEYGADVVLVTGQLVDAPG